MNEQINKQTEESPLKQWQTPALLNLNSTDTESTMFTARFDVDLGPRLS